MQYLYPKEIIRHFKHPKNLGRIKNPDAIGEAGNLVCGDVMRIYLKIKKNGEEKIADIKGEVFGCLPPQEEIVTNNGDWESISTINNESSILNGAGKKATILRKTVREYDGEILKIIPFVSPFNTFFITPEHPVLCIKRKWLKSARRTSRRCCWLRINENELLSAKPRYVKAEKIEPGDYLIFVFDRKVKDNKTFTKKIMRLLGYYLSEGYVTSKGYTVAFSFNKNEKIAIREVKHLIRGVLGKEAKERTRKNVKEIYVCSKKLANFLISSCGRMARFKKLSKDILLLPFYKQLEMIKTYLIGDGSTRKRWPNESLTYTAATASKSLAIQIQEILARGGIFASIKKYTLPEHTIEGRKIKQSTTYEITFKLQRKHKFVHMKKRCYLVPVKRIEKQHYTGPVYNLELNNKPHSYLVKGFRVHNCIVAIANTSLLTTLVKGKSLAEALEIKKEDLIRKLGGRKRIPPFKIHCSILALDALKEAIYNYYTKNNVTIPESLRREHERIQGTIKEIEKKHKEFIKLERELLTGEK